MVPGAQIIASFSLLGGSRSDVRNSIEIDGKWHLPRDRVNQMRASGDAVGITPRNWPLAWS